MDLNLAKRPELNLTSMMREVGYHINDNRSDTPNYVRRLRPGLSWPRYHLYVKESPEKYLLSLHLDQKADTRHYNPTSVHNGEYDGPLVETELQRIKSILWK